VTLARFLLSAASGGGTFPVPPDPTPPLPTASALTSAPNGGNNPWTIPGALYHATPNKTFITYVDGSGNVEGIEYDHATDTLGGPYTIHSGFHVDAHDSPSILRRASDGKFLAVYSFHNSTPINIKVGNTANSLNGWNLATNLDSQLGGSRYTDAAIYEENSLLQLFYRDEPSAGTDSRWCRSTCDPASPTTGWAAQQIIYRIASTRSYMISCHDDANGRIHFIVTNGASSGFTKLGHFYLNVAAGTYHQSDGASMGSPPFNFTHVTQLYSGSANVFASNVVVDGSGHPVVAFQDTVSGDIRYIYGRWNGSAWLTTYVVSAGTGYEYNGSGTGFAAYGECIDDGDPNRYWLIRDVSGQSEIFLYTTANGGASFTSEQVTTGSTALQTQMICVRNPHTDLRVFWQRGTWTTYTNWNVGLVAAGIS
jgi:hypothetical protein